MLTSETIIHVFKTNIKTFRDTKKVDRHLQQCTCIREWNVDRQDIDCVLRVVSQNLSPGEVIALVKHAGFYCVELQ